MEIFGAELDHGTLQLSIVMELAECDFAKWLGRKVGRGGHYNHFDDPVVG